MEVISPEESVPTAPEKLKSSEVDKKDDFFDISSNWKVVGGKSIRETVTTVLQKDFSGSMALDDIANENTSLEIQPESEHEPCTIEIKLKNGQKIVRMGIASEASVLEIFKDSGEYATTIFSEFIDEFEGCTVYLGGVVFDKPTHEASIKFTRIKNERSSVYLYGIRLVLEDSGPSDPPPEKLDYNNIISDFLTLLHPRKPNSTHKNPSNTIPKSFPLTLKDSGMTEYFQKFMDRFPTDDKSSKSKVSGNNNDSPDEEFTKKIDKNSSNPDFCLLEEIIESKLKGMETRLMQRLEQVEKNTQKSLEEILKKLDALKN